MSVHGHDPAGERVVLHRGGEAFAALSREWDALAAAHAVSPYATHAWLSAFLDGFGGADRLFCPVLHAADGSLRAAACLVRDRAGSLATLTNVHSGDWDVVAADDAARERIWRAIVDFRPLRLILDGLIASGPSAEIARRVLDDGGYRVMATPGVRSPYLPLPGSYEELLRAGSRNMRGQVARRGRQLEREGTLTFRTVHTGPSLETDLDAFLTLEAAGWKGSSGTAILRAPATEPVYRAFVRTAAERGWLRLHLLELDGRLIAGDLGCAIGDTGFLIKTTFDEELSRLSPGLVLRGRVLEASIAEGLKGYDFLGPDDAYKLRWTGTVRPRVTLRAHRPPLHVPARAWHRRVRPALKTALHEVRRRRTGDERAGAPARSEVEAAP